MFFLVVSNEVLIIIFAADVMLILIDIVLFHFLKLLFSINTAEARRINILVVTLFFFRLRVLMLLVLLSI